MQRKNTLKRQILFIAQFSILLAIEALVCFTPLGSIPLGPIVATTAMIPVVITAILLGTKAGTLMGFFAGLFSFLVWTFLTPDPLTAFLFTPFYPPGNIWSLVICFVPRILVGTVAGLTYQLFARKKETGAGIFQYISSGILGSMTNTLLVLSGLIFFFARPVFNLIQGDASFAWGPVLGYVGITIITNGFIEAALAGILAVAICKPIQKYLRVN